jgi:hypothetical protein
VARRVDHVQHVVLPTDLPRQPHVLRLDGDAAFALDVHAVQVLGPHLPLLDHAGDLQHAVGKGRLAVVDVRDDAEVPDQLRVGERRVGESGHSGSSRCLRVRHIVPRARGPPARARSANLVEL